MNIKKPSMKEHNTMMVQSPYHRSSTVGSDDASQKDTVNALVTPAANAKVYKPVHQKAQVQESYNRMKRVLRNR